MTNLVLNNVGDLNNTTSAASTINANSAAIVTAVTSSVAKAGDQMSGTLDMNSNPIINLPAPTTADSPIRLIDFSSTSVTPSVLSGNNVYTGQNTFSGTTNFSVVNITTINGAVSVTTANISTSNVSIGNITTANITTANIVTSNVSTLNATSGISTPSITGCFGTFRADFGGTSQTYNTITANPYFLVSMNNIENNSGSSYFASVTGKTAVFVPPTNTKIVHLDATVWITAGPTSNSAVALKWIKNGTWSASSFQLTGTDIVAGVGAETNLGISSVWCHASTWDVPSPGDYYQLGIDVIGSSTGSAVTIDGNAAHSYVSGFYLQ